MADNVSGTLITDLEEAQTSGLTDNTLLIAEPETPPTKKVKLSTLWAWIKSKIAAWTLGSYDEIMAATNAGYLPDALAVKQGFTQLNTNIANKKAIPDYGNIIGSMNSTGKDASYTATEDCYIVLRRLYGSGTMTVKINDQNVYAPHAAANNEASGISLVLAKGDVITVSNPVSCVASVFSLK